MLDHSNVFLPRVNSCPRAAIISAIGRGLKSLYAGLLEQTPPENIATLLKRIDQGPRRLAVNSRPQSRPLRDQSPAPRA
jgi:hypothetical protein